MCLDKTDPKYLDRRSRVEERTAPCAVCSHQLAVSDVKCHRHRGRNPAAAALHLAYCNTDLMGTGPYLLCSNSSLSILAPSFTMTSRTKSKFKRVSKQLPMPSGTPRIFCVIAGSPSQSALKCSDNICMVNIFYFGCTHWALTTQRKRNLLSFFFSCARRILCLTLACVRRSGRKESPMHKYSISLRFLILKSPSPATD